MIFRSLLVFVAAGCLVGCGSEAPPKNAAPDASGEARAVRVAAVELRALGSDIRASGLIAPREEAAVAPEVAGYGVQQVFVEPGAFVRRGQPLLQLDPLLIQAPLAQARAQVEQQRVALGRAEREAARVAGLDEEGVLSREAVDQRQAEVGAARALLRAAQAQLQEVENRAARLTVRTPVSGLVLERAVRPGDVAGQSQGPAFRIARDGLLEVDAEAPEGDLSSLREGEPAEVRLAGGRSVTGTIRLIAPAVDPETRLGRVRVLLPRGSGARAGGSAEVVFRAEGAAVLAVPEAAIRFRAGGAAVTVVGAGDRVQEVAVRTGRRGGGWVQLVEGPAAGTRVVLGGAAFLLSGDRVRSVAATQEAR